MDWRTELKQIARSALRKKQLINMTRFGHKHGINRGIVSYYLHQILSDQEYRQLIKIQRPKNSEPAPIPRQFSLLKVNRCPCGHDDIGEVCVKHWIANAAKLTDKRQLNNEAG